jgi:uncharacterized protein
MRTITLEEHFVTVDFLKATESYLPPSPRLKTIQKQLLDIGTGRIAAMDEGAIDMQVLSLAASGLDHLDPATGTALLHDANDQLAAAVQANPLRFAGFTNLALKDPISAAKEFERGVERLGFKGALVNGTAGGAFLDDPRFTPLFEVAQALDVPIYLHPAPPPTPVREAYFSNLPGIAGDLLSTAAWGWHVETGMHVLRLIICGVFDRFPGLQIIIGHMGENLPFSLARAGAVLESATGHLQSSVADTFHEHFYVTNSGYFTQAPFLCALEVVGVDRLMYSVDYPFSANTTGQAFLKTLAVSPEDFAKITHGNAKRLLRL